MNFSPLVTVDQPVPRDWSIAAARAAAVRRELAAVGRGHRRAARGRRPNRASGPGENMIVTPPETDSEDNAAS